MSTVGKYTRCNGKIAWVRENDEHGRDGEEMAGLVERRNGTILVVLVVPHTLQTFSFNYVAADMDDALALAEAHVTAVKDL